MAHVFAITSASDTLALDKGRGEISFTVTNSSGRPLRGRAKAVPLGNTKAEWLTLRGESERDFSSDGTQQFAVAFAAPEGTPPGKYPFMLYVVSVVNPDEVFTEGPSVTAEVAATPTPPPPPVNIWKWLIPAIVLVLLVGGLITWLALKPDNSTPPSTPTPTPTPTPVANLGGTWVNQSSTAAATVTKFVIVQNGNHVAVHASAKCPVNAIDLGEASGDLVNNQVNLSWSAPCANLTTQLTMIGPDLRAASNVQFLQDASGASIPAVSKPNVVELFRPFTRFTLDKANAADLKVVPDLKTH